MDETAVKDVSASNINEAKYYSLDGRQLSQPQTKDEVSDQQPYSMEVGL